MDYFNINRPGGTYTGGVPAVHNGLYQSVGDWLANKATEDYRIAQELMQQNSQPVGNAGTVAGNVASTVAGVRLPRTNVGTAVVSTVSDAVQTPVQTQQGSSTNQNSGGGLVVDTVTNPMEWLDPSKVPSVQATADAPVAMPLAYSNHSTSTSRAENPVHPYTGNSYNFTNNNFHNNGSDPTFAAWSGLNMSPNQQLNMNQMAALARLQGGAYGNLANMRSAQAQSAAQEAINDPRSIAMVQDAMRQGATLEEARYGVMGKLLLENGQPGAFHAYALPGYYNAARGRQDGQAGLAMMLGQNYDAQSNLFGVPNNVESYRTLDNGDVEMQYGNTKVTLPQSKLPQLAMSLAAMPAPMRNEMLAKFPPLIQQSIRNQLNEVKIEREQQKLDPKSESYMKRSGLKQADFEHQLRTGVLAYDDNGNVVPGPNSKQAQQSTTIVRTTTAATD